MVLRRERRELVEVLTLDRPEASNALDPELLDALSSAFEELSSDDGARAVVLTGAGERAFCAGMDLRAFGTQREADDAGDGDDGEPARARSRVERADPFGGGFPKPLVAAVNGAAVGGGFELALGCDLIVAADHARFGLPEVKRGLLAGGGGTLLGTRIPLNLALEVALTGDLLSAQQAAAWGVVNRVVPAGDLLATAIELASTIAANGPLAVEVTKRLTRQAVLDGPAAGRPSPEDIRLVFESEDAKEGAKAFVEKRAPSWSGR